VFDVTLGTLSGGDLIALEEWGLIGDDMFSTNGGEARRGDSGTAGEGQEIRKRENEGHTGISWFNDLVDGSRLGKTRRTGETREGPGWRVEWEIVEWTEGEDVSAPGTPSTGQGGAGAKRKLGELESEDTSMQG